jgi:hypothetical protein
MATYNSDQYAAGNPVPAHGEYHGLQVARFTVTCSAAPATTDTINFGYMPANARVVDAYVSPSDMDTGGPTLTLNVGDAGSATRLFSAAPAGAGATTKLSQQSAFGYKYAAKTLVTGVAQANATTPAAGTIELAIIYFIDE